MSEEAYASVLHFAHCRTVYGENEFATISRLLEGVSAEELTKNPRKMQETTCKFCYAETC